MQRIRFLSDHTKSGFCLIAQNQRFLLVAQNQRFFCDRIESEVPAQLHRIRFLSDHIGL